MDDTERRTAKPARNSRFDRRSRSPPAVKPAESRRSRSPLARDSGSPAPEAKKPSADPAAAAGTERIHPHIFATPADICLLAAAAARINAQIQAKKGIQHVDVPPIQSTLSPAPKSASPAASGSGNSAALVNGEMYIADGDYIRDIEVNDLRNRYTLTKGSTQKMVNTPCVNIPLIHQALLYLDIAKFASRQNPSFPFHFSSKSKQASRQAARKVFYVQNTARSKFLYWGFSSLPSSAIALLLTTTNPHWHLLTPAA